MGAAPHEHEAKNRKMSGEHDHNDDSWVMDGDCDTDCDADR